MCRFAAAFGFQDHPNVEVIAVSDLLPDRCAGLAKAARCGKTYPSLEEMVKDDKIEAIFVATDAPQHAKHCIEVLKHGKHVASAVRRALGRLRKASSSSKW
ncbi:MAG: Gfo/Idh/MocA family oxidoreductase [Planctomycetota bacterium]|nr:Gfo/Idh/MocA family oxidoreductase [Planctomycetota bacterium]